MRPMCSPQDRPLSVRCLFEIYPVLKTTYVSYVAPLGSPINRINVVREEDTSLWLPWLALTDIRNGEALRKGIHSVLVPVASMRKDGHVAPVCLFEHVGTDVGKIIEYAAGIDSIWHAIL